MYKRNIVGKEYYKRRDGLNKFKKVLYISFRAYDNVIIGTPITNK